MRQTYMQLYTIVDTSTNTIQHGTAPTAYYPKHPYTCIVYAGGVVVSCSAVKHSRSDRDGTHSPASLSFFSF
jgi:hypothetical protein